MTRAIQIAGAGLLKPASDIRTDLHLMAAGFRQVRDEIDVSNPLWTVLNEWQAHCDVAGVVINDDHIQRNVICYARLAKAMSVDILNYRNMNFRAIINWWFDAWNGD